MRIVIKYAFIIIFLITATASIGFIVALIAAATINLSMPNHPEPSKTGITFDQSNGRLEVEFDTFSPSCEGDDVTVIISANRKEARIECKDIAHTFQLPISQGMQQFAIVWSW